MGGKNYQTLPILILKDFLQWPVAFDQQNKIKVLINVQQRLKLFHVLFLAEQTPLELSEGERQKFSKIHSLLFNYFVQFSHKVDIFDADNAMTEFNKQLNTQVQNLCEQLSPLSADKYLNHLLSNVKKQMAKFNDQKNILSQTFGSLMNKGWLLSRSEQKRHDIHVQLKLLVQGFEAINNSIVDLISYAEIKNAPLSTVDNTKEIAKSIDKLLNDNFTSCANLVLWHVSTEEGRLRDLKQLTTLINSDFDIHLIQNPLTSDAKEKVDQHFNPSSYTSKRN